jgi:hypothetical protein
MPIIAVTTTHIIPSEPTVMFIMVKNEIAFIIPMDSREVCSFYQSDSAYGRRR